MKRYEHIGVAESLFFVVLLNDECGAVYNILRYLVAYIKLQFFLKVILLTFLTPL